MKKTAIYDLSLTRNLHRNAQQRADKSRENVEKKLYQAQQQDPASESEHWSKKLSSQQLSIGFDLSVYATHDHSGRITLHPVLRAVGGKSRSATPVAAEPTGGDCATLQPKLNCSESENRWRKSKLADTAATFNIDTEIRSVDSHTLASNQKTATAAANTNSLPANSRKNYLAPSRPKLESFNFHVDLRPHRTAANAPQVDHSRLRVTNNSSNVTLIEKRKNKADTTTGSSSSDDNSKKASRRSSGRTKTDDSDERLEQLSPKLLVLLLDKMESLLSELDSNRRPVHEDFERIGCGPLCSMTSEASSRNTEAASKTSSTTSRAVQMPRCNLSLSELKTEYNCGGHLRRT